MARQTRQKPTARATVKKTTVPRRAAGKKTTKAAAPLRSAPASLRSKTRNGKPSASKTVERGTAGAVATREAPPAPPKKPGYYEALAMYESGVRALQRHDYDGAAAQFRTIIERYPEERELQERSQLYLRVCERETARRPATPQTAQERVYAATVALNAGETSAAVEHLRRALTDAPDSDHAHYIMSVALASKGESTQALEHLRQAITLNPDNRALARQDPDLEPVRGVDGFWDLLDVPAG